MAASLQPPGKFPAITEFRKQSTIKIPPTPKKVGEEGLELALAGVVQSDAEIVGEAADLLYHVLLLLKVKNLSLSQVVAELESRHAERGTARAP